jgi:hypothetical protein
VLRPSHAKIVARYQPYANFRISLDNTKVGVVY